ncbi:hypothetical protein [Actinoallomurus soli]|uniref:hypothetical protein n=1 Tax=Actinoallomurus soli TaxID=2952535 RepID=UPI0020928273|nr:hypothetical protein [Actinoallomurus soli]MCO5968245.1 hypothetical protein [Actinoallomurus soli]
MMRLGARLPGLTIALGVLLLAVGVASGTAILDALGAVGLIAGVIGALSRARR